jgi:phosphatidylglycerol---prolipoprotein diacylglyceryl transferase
MSHFYWDPDPIFWTIPVLGRPVAWYGVLFALGFFFGYYLTRWQVKRVLREGDPGKYTDRLLWLTILGTVIGARLAHVFFYEWPRYQDHLIDIVKVWNGGLSSHGALVGVVVALVVHHFWSGKRMRFLQLFDLVTVTGAFIGAIVRLGNFVNQELVGRPTSVPWAVIFGHPAGGQEVVPRHPVQLYESLSYFAVCGFLVWLSSKRVVRERAGLISGLFLVLAFGARIGLETFKVHLSAVLSEASGWQMGQLLSVPVVLVGFALIGWSLRRRTVRG